MSHYNCFIVLNKEDFIGLENKECIKKAKEKIKSLLSKYYIIDEVDYINFLNNEDELRKDFENNIEIKGLYSLANQKFISSYPNTQNNIKEKEMIDYEIRNCKVKDVFSNFKDFAINYHGYKKEYFDDFQKFDHYEIGGRFSGNFLLKKNIEYKEKGILLSRKIKGFVDIIRKKDIDIKKQKQVSKKEADVIWNKVLGANLDISKYKSWNQLLKEGIELNESIEKTRAKYLSQEELINISKDLNLLGSACPLDLICLGDYEKFIEEQFFINFSSYAILKDNKWIDKDDFTDKNGVIDFQRFKKNWQNLFDSIDENDWLINIDCHI